MTTTNSWLALTEYSTKYHVSISTLRRRIKADDIRYRFEDGKYLILDEMPKKLEQAGPHRPSLTSDVTLDSASPVSRETEIQAISVHQNNETGESVLTAANKLLIDLKKAYTQILQEKEEQIMYLKEEIIDLRTLVKVLESENHRLHDIQN